MYPFTLPACRSIRSLRVSDDDAALAARVASRFSCPSYTDERQMIRDAKPDFVFSFCAARADVSGGFLSA